MMPQVVRRGGFVAAAIALLVSCGGEAGPAPRTLTTPDVTGMLPGNATGTSFSGSYNMRASQLEACRCRSGSCASIIPLTGDTHMVVQADGQLTLGSCVGGVNSDGTFWCGGQDVNQDSLVLMVDQGTFKVSGGVVTGYEVTQELTLVLSPDHLDCDLRGHLTDDRVGP
jgi:hypothetical protein